MTLSELVTEYRTEHGLSQRQFALTCGVSNGYISMLEKNMNPKTGQPLVPSMPVLKKIATGMGMSLTDLFTKVDDMPVDLASGDENKPATDDDDELVSEIITLLAQLSDDRKQEALNYLRYLSKRADNS